MKVKILIVPLAIAIAVGLCVWLVYPTYSNGEDGVKEKLTQLKNERKIINSLKERSDNANQLSLQIEENSSDRDILFEFLPSTYKEEQILDSLNFLATQNSLAVSEISIGKESRLGSSTSTSVSNDKSSKNKIELPKAEEVNVSVAMSGSYENIRNFLGNLEKTGRQNNFSTLEIKKKESSGEEETSSGNLDLVFAVKFSKLKEAVATDESIENVVFSQNNLDLGAISKIKQSRNTEVFKLNVGEVGKSNLFSL